MDSGQDVQVTPCSFTSQGGVIALGTYTAGVDDALLISIPASNGTLVISIKSERRLRTEVAPLLQSIQQGFRTETDALLQLPRAVIGISTAPASCGQ